MQFVKIQQPVIINGLPSKFNLPLKRARPPKRFKCEAIIQANWEQQISSSLNYLKPEPETRFVCKKIK